jgi:hypothetical protein
MRTLFLVLLCILALLPGGCAKRQTDPAEDAFKKKFQTLRLGMTQAEVLNSLGQPSKTQSQIEEENDTIQAESGAIQIHRGDPTKVWAYTFGRNDYTLWFAMKSTNDTSTGVLFMQNVISVGDAIRIK